MNLALFDLDHTLLSGDSDVLWCEFLMNEGLLQRAEFEARNADLARRYADNTVTSREFCEFYASTLAGRSLAEWRPWCERFLHEMVVPLISPAARELVESHRARGDRLVLTTATSRVLTELTAAHLRIGDLIATEVEVIRGVCSGRTTGTLNMREGKVRRLIDWLEAERLDAALLDTATFYSDSINDSALLLAVGSAVAVDPDPRLEQLASASGWPSIHLQRDTR